MTSRMLLAFPWTLSLLVFAGCAALDAPLDKTLTSGEPAKGPEVAPPEVPSLFVEIRPENKEPERARLPMTDEAVYVQGILDRSRVVQRFGRVKIQIWRPLPDGSGHHKLDVPYDRKSKTVQHGYDYALRPNDRLVLFEDSSTVVDDVLESATAALRPLSG